MSGRVILASASPRRAELLRLLFARFEILPADVDEAPLPGASPAETAIRLAVQKAKAVAEKAPEALVIGADTVVEVGGDALGKPAGAEEAAAMLARLSGRAHRVHTGVGVFAGGRSLGFAETTDVWVRALTPEDIAGYIALGESLDKAGAYGIQGAFARFIPRIEGCYFNVMGLPVARLFAELGRFGLL